MNLMFWKKKAPGNTEKEADDDRTVALARGEETAEENEADAVRPGLLSRLRNALSALRKPRGSSTETGENEKNETDNDKTVAIQREAKAAEDKEADSRDDEAPTVAPVRNLKKRLIIGGAMGLLIILLAGIGFAITKIVRPQPEQKPDTAEASHASHPEPHAETPQAEIEALKKKNAELQAKIEAIQSGQPQKQAPTSPSMAARNNTATASSGGSDEMTVSNKDPKAAAQALKAAIEAMNAGSAKQSGK